MSSDELVETIKWSERFSSTDADVTFISSDGVGFRIHSVFLRAHSEALSPEPGSSLDEPVPLSEPAEVLNLLFDFIYPDREPVVELEADFDTLLSLSEAASKYQVFPALRVCIPQLQSNLPNHAFDIFVYGYRHVLHDLVNAAAIYAVDSDPADVFQSVSEDVYKSWLLYRQNWTRVRKRALTLALTVYLPTSPDSNFGTVLRRLMDKLSSLANLDSTFAQFSGNNWKASVERDTANIPKFTEWIGWKETEQKSRTTYVGDQPRVTIVTCDGIEQDIPVDILCACTKNLGDTLLLNAGDNLRVKVPEASSTIDLLLRFIKPVQHPDLKSLDFVDLKNLALAAEKYSIRQAKGFCRVLMTKKLKTYPHDLFHYAAEAHYLDILDQTAPLVLGPINSFNDAIKRLPPRLVSAWVLYYQQWQDAARIFVDAVLREGCRVKKPRHVGGYSNSNDSTQKGTCDCPGGNFHQLHVAPLMSLLITPGEMRNLDAKISDTPCTQSQKVYAKCGSMVKEKIDAIPPLSSFL